MLSDGERAFAEVAEAAVEAQQLTETEAAELAERLMKYPHDARERAALDMLAEPPFFAPFRRVLVHGLTKAELNGLGGYVLPPGMAPGGTRFPVMLIGGGPRKILVRPSNLRLVPYDGVSYDDEFESAVKAYEKEYRQMAEAEGRAYKPELLAASRAAEGLGRLRFAVGDRVECDLGGR